MTEAHYVAQIDVRKVTKNIPTQAYPRNNPPPPTRTIAELTKLIVKASTREKLVEKVTAHLHLLDDDDEIEETA